MMAAYAIAATPAAAKQFRGLPEGAKDHFRIAFQMMAHDPQRPRAGLDISPLAGTPGGYRLRVGDFRGIYQVERTEVLFTRFGHRSKVYRV